MPKAKVLFIDIETQPDLMWAWGVYDAYGLEVAEHWKLISFSAEWLDGDHITRALPDYKGYKPGGDDEKLARDIWKLLDEADIVVAHNGVSFDIKKLNARFLVHGFPPPSPYKVVDTKRAVKQVAAFSSNKLDWLCKQLGLGHKVEHEGWPLWRACMLGDLAAWERMKKYNRHDVVLLRRLYKTISPWISQPNAAMYAGKVVCVNPACGSKHLQWRGEVRNKTQIYRRFQCQDCGKWGRTTKAEAGKRATVVGI